MNAELSHHLGYEAGADRPELVTNQRNGSTAKSVLTGDGAIRIDTPRDRDGSFTAVFQTAINSSVIAHPWPAFSVEEAV